ncbi:MAG: hypothetical protein J6U05_00290, partial [Neisseriaceae bacterium]|nr:hypothetical protein [Neisseriaceae bacterium]
KMKIIIRCCLLAFALTTFNHNPYFLRNKRLDCIDFFKKCQFRLPEKYFALPFSLRAEITTHSLSAMLVMTVRGCAVFQAA